jgi:hypothetical protein
MLQAAMLTIINDTLNYSKGRERMWVIFPNILANFCSTLLFSVHIAEHGRLSDNKLCTHILCCQSHTVNRLLWYTSVIRNKCLLKVVIFLALKINWKIKPCIDMRLCIPSIYEVMYTQYIWGYLYPVYMKISAPEMTGLDPSQHLV